MNRDAAMQLGKQTPRPWAEGTKVAQRQQRYLNLLFNTSNSELLKEVLEGAGGRMISADVSSTFAWETPGS